MTSPLHNVSMIVAEKGGLWAPWVERFRAETPDVVVVLQQVGESLHEMAMRVRARVSELEQDGFALEQAVLVGGGRTDHEALSSRSLAIRAMATGMATQGGGRVMLDDAGDDRFSMAAIAATVSDLVLGTGVTVEHAAAAPTPAAATATPLARVA